jgi:UDP-N-acetylmuramoyl-tripeptide--D-alanyl-D-alanine ligase
MEMFVLSLLIYLIYINLLSNRSLYMLQQNRYNRGYRYIKWIFKNFKNNFLNYRLGVLVFVVMLFVSVDVDFLIGMFTGLLAVFSLFTYKVFKDEQKGAKLPFKYTARIKRLIVTNNIVNLIPLVVMVLTYNENYVDIYYVILSVITLLNYFSVILINFINRPVEKMVGLYFRNKAVSKLNSMTGMEVIGVTGSYGKTSTKNILYDILEIKYNVFKTPANFNTPYGLMITINEHMDKYNDFFIAEMGACKKGEIKELCDLVHPKYGVLTKVGLAHLETFGSEEIIQSTKFELIESLPSDGIGILNGDDEKQLSYKIKNNCEIVWIGIDNKEVDVYADNLELSYKGTKFDVVFKDLNETYSFETKLLGRNNIYNILGGIALGRKLGISIPELQKAVSRVQPIEHRLSMTKYYDINIIDDAYNSNPVGCKMALEVLGMMPGKKMVVTPGMIEVGEKEDEVNKEFGRQIGKTVDEAILIGENKTKAIYEGLIEVGFDKEHIHVLNDVMDAFDLMVKLKGENTYVLLENDLPDSFNEKLGGKK